jgi:hypothetical protein
MGCWQVAVQERLQKPLPTTIHSCSLCEDFLGHSSRVDLVGEDGGNCHSGDFTVQVMSVNCPLRFRTGERDPRTLCCIAFDGVQEMGIKSLRTVCAFIGDVEPRVIDNGVSP